MQGSISKDMTWLSKYAPNENALIWMGYLCWLDPIVIVDTTLMNVPEGPKLPHQE